MGVTQYIGARYVPIFADPAEWTSERTYEPLTIVLHEGNSFTSKQFVPVGIGIDNDAFWAETGNYNAQVEAYRQEVLNNEETLSEHIEQSEIYKSEIDEKLENIKASSSEQLEALPGYIFSDKFKKIGQFSNFEGNIFQAFTKIGEYYYVVYYPQNDTSTFLGKYDSDFNLIGSYNFGRHQHGNSVNIDPYTGNIVCAGRDIIDVVSTDLELVKTFNTGGDYINEFCISKKGFAIARCGGSFIPYTKINDVYCAFGINSAISNIPLGMPQGYADMCTVESGNSELIAILIDSLASDGTGKNQIILMGNYANPVCIIGFPNTENNSEIEGIVFVKYENKFYISDIYGNVYTLDISEYGNWFNYNSSSSKSFREAGVEMCWQAPTKQQLADYFPDDYVTVNNVVHLVRFRIPLFIRNTSIPAIISTNPIRSAFFRRLGGYASITFISTLIVSAKLIRITETYTYSPTKQYWYLSYFTANNINDTTSLVNKTFTENTTLAEYETAISDINTVNANFMPGFNNGFDTDFYGLTKVGNPHGSVGIFNIKI